MNTTGRTIEELLCALASVSASTEYTLATGVALLIIYFLKFIYDAIQQQQQRKSHARAQHNSINETFTERQDHL